MVDQYDPDSYLAGPAASAPYDPDAYLNQAATPAAAPESPLSLADQIKRQAGLAGRAVINGVTGIPQLAADAGIAARNLATGHVDTSSLGSLLFGSQKAEQEGAIPSYSGQFQQSLTGLGLPEPKTWQEKGAGIVESALAGSRIPAPQAADQAPPGFNSPGNLSPAEQQALTRGQAMGMKATPGVAAGSKPLQQLESKLESQPWTSGPAEAIKSNNADVLNRAWAKAIGENSDTVDSTTLARANDRLGEVFNSVRDARVRQIDPDEFTKRLSSVESEFEGLLPHGTSITDHPLVKRLTTLAEEGNATGEQLGSLTSKLGKAASKEMTTPMGDRDLGQALFHVKDYVDDLVSKGLEPAEQASYDAARQQYRSLMQLTSRVGNLNPNTGNVNGVSLASYLQKADKRGFLYGGNDSDAYAATRFAQAFKPIVGNSGTATRSLSPGDLLTAPVGIAGNLASRAYYKGLLTPGAPSPDTISKVLMGGVPTSQDSDSK